MMYRDKIVVCLSSCQRSVTKDRDAMFEQDWDKVTLAILWSLQEVAKPLSALQGGRNSVIHFSFIDSLSSNFSLFETHRPPSPSLRHVSHWLNTEGGWYVPTVRLLSTIFRFIVPWSSRPLSGPAGSHRWAGFLNSDGAIPSCIYWKQIVMLIYDDKPAKFTVRFFRYLYYYIALNIATCFGPQRDHHQPIISEKYSIKPD